MWRYCSDEETKKSIAQKIREMDDEAKEANEDEHIKMVDEHIKMVENIGENLRWASTFLTTLH